MRLPLLVVHIMGGMVGLLAGAVAMIYRKGSRGHRIAGDVFVIAMIVMGASASWLALRIHQTDNLFGGLLTVYMISTAWWTGRRREHTTSLLDWGALVFAAALTAAMAIRTMLVVRGVVELQAGVPVGMLFFTTSIPLLAAAGDLRLLLRRGISGTPRIARHLWRMCYGWFIASGSFFLGKQEHFPIVLRKQYLLIPLAVLPLVLMIYWLVRARVGKARMKYEWMPARSQPSLAAH